MFKPNSTSVTTLPQRYTITSTSQSQSTRVYSTPIAYTTKQPRTWQYQLALN
ncbi:hypothetical protein [Lactiplantibacillus songbeiensis]|uniref:Uncharacterized protein n=1 Tax=Lactiplantibacillus songbeiensis TaxID=2559920 RepID=A0ABW4C0G2_9LACO|nr:hypothetical protein [Lactiplantibacillus songbeiensis]